MQCHQGPRSALTAGERAVLVIVRRRYLLAALGDRGEAEVGGEGTERPAAVLAIYTQGWALVWLESGLVIVNPSA